MKKLIMMLVCLMLLAGLSIPVFASASMDLTSSKTTINAGDTITITVSANVDNCAQGGIEVTYDNKVLTLTSGECTLNADIKYFDTAAGDGGFAFSEKTNISGKAFTLIFKVNDAAALGKTTVKVKLTTTKDSATREIALTVACVHKYDNNCDTSCNTCGTTREAKHTWDNGKITTKPTCTTTGEKTYTCTVCATTKKEVVTKLAHVYDNACDSKCNNCDDERKTEHEWTRLYDANNHWMKCKVCNQTKDIKKHELPSKYTTNTKTHGYKCTVCNALVKEEKHKFDNDCDVNCNTCGYTRNVNHSYSKRWSSDETGHWHECEICHDKLEAVAHIPGPEATETSDQICTECGFVLQQAQKHEHVMAGDWLNDETTHWYRCECGEELPPEEHVWGNPVQEGNNMVTMCTECLYKQLEAIEPLPTEPDETVPVEPTKPVETLPEPSTKVFEMPWKTLAICASIMALLSITLNVILMCLILRKPKKRGKYDR